MKIDKLFDTKKAVLSFEIFPPKQTSSISTIYETIDALAPLRPDYISVTYGAGGSTSKTTVEIASIIKKKYNISSLAHLTCYSTAEAEVGEILSQLEHEGVCNILALRGDKPDRCSENTQYIKNDFVYSSDLARYIHSNHNFCIGGACYPEGHPESSNLERDINNLRYKIEAGVSFLITQLFFDNNAFYRFMDNAHKLNIDVPIQAGIMPINNRKQIERIIELTNASIPKKLIRILDKFEHNSEAIKDAGIAFATEQIVELLANDVRGIHIYTMNRPQVAKEMVRNLGSLFYTINSPV